MKIISNALIIKPNFICIVPENRKEITTEGGLNLLKNKNKIKKILDIFKKNKIRTSLFINPTSNDVILSKELGAECIEIHTGRFANLVKSKKNTHNELLRIKKSCRLANKIGLEVHAGHGLDYKSTEILSKINEIKEFNIGHFIIGESIFYGIKTVIKKFKKIIK
jgi:pyridoxine 5-phosphate synthase